MAVPALQVWHPALCSPPRQGGMALLLPEAATRAENVTQQEREEWEVRGVREGWAWGSLAFLTSTSRELSFSSWAPESSGLQSYSCGRDNQKTCWSREGWSGNRFPCSPQQQQPSCLPMAGQAEGTQASQPTQLTESPPSKPLHPSPSHHAAQNLEGWGSAHTGVTQPDWRATLKEASGCQLTTLCNVPVYQNVNQQQCLK